MKTPKRSQKLFARAVKSLPGGVNSPVRAFKAVGGSPHFIARASGARITDVDGTSRRTSSASSTSSGLGAPKLVPRLAWRASAEVRPRGAWPWIIGPHDPT